MRAAAYGSRSSSSGECFADLNALNAWLEEQCIAQWGEIQHGAIADVHGAEAGSLMPMGRS